MAKHGLFFVLALILSFPIRAEHDGAGLTSQSPAPAAAPKKIFYSECTAAAVGFDARKLDLGSFVIDISDYSFWFSEEGFRIAENAKALGGYGALTGQFKGMQSKSGKLQLTLAQQKFNSPGDSPFAPNQLASKDVEVEIDKPFSIKLDGKGAVRELSLACEPLSEEAGANRKAYVTAVERLRAAYFLLSHPNELLPARSPEQIASKVTGNLSIARELLPAVTNERNHAQVEKYIVDIERLAGKSK